ncbi:MAG: ribonuclease HII [Eggerthellaceae bacterium]|nr:ribonuclease HII [Eggerthellaceae bacterium]
MKKYQQTVEDINSRLARATREELVALERSLAADTRKGVKTALERARRRIVEEEAEQARLEGLYAFDYQYGLCVIGLDEVGRGPVAGPLAVGAVILDTEKLLPGLNDSKQIVENKRKLIAAQIKETARAYTVEYVSPEKIDEIGMSAALHLAFSNALACIDQSGLHVEKVLIDGMPLHLDEREVNIIKGDTQSASIAAASIIAKVERDELMCSYAQQYPQYQFDKNKGYASPEHIAAIKAYGLCPLHRKSFCSAFLQDSLF